MRRKADGARARLFINEQEVGTVEVKGWDDSWGFGEFAAGESFRPYARHFGDWSWLLHAPRADDRLTDADRDALRKVEYEIDRFQAELLFVDSGKWRRIAELNIDGPLVEWHEDLWGEDTPRAA